MKTVTECVNLINDVLAGATVMDIADDQGVGRLDRDPVLQPDKPDEQEVRYPQFFRDDGMSREPSNKDAIEEF